MGAGDRKAIDGRVHECLGAINVRWRDQLIELDVWASAESLLQ